MEKQYEVLLKYINELEGSKLHRNKNEHDVTNAYGIYRYQHPKDPIWNYIDSIAASVTRAPSHAWDSKMITSIDAKINKATDLELSYNFYKKYLGALDITQYPEDLVVSVVTCFVNTQDGTWKALQEALNDCHKYNLFTFIPPKMQPNGNILLVDGKFGNTSKGALKAYVDNLKTKDVETQRLYNIIFKNCMLLYMKTHYAELAINRTEDFIGVLKGWCNRVENTQHI